MNTMSCESFLIIDTSYPINNRNEKLIVSIKKFFPNANIRVVTWDKRNICKDKIEHYTLYKKPCRPGNKIKKFTYLFDFKRFVNKAVKDFSPQVIIASHWDSLYCVPSELTIKPLVIYDNIDIPDGPYPVRMIELLMEKRSLKKADLIIHASRFFKELYNGVDTEQFILENKPVFPIKKRQSVNKVFTISFIGTLRYFETLTSLVDAIKNQQSVQLNFYGNGPDEGNLKNYCKGIENVSFYGRYNYKDIIPFYDGSDLIWAAYPSKDFNVKYAISNKYYESMFLSVPAVFAKETLLGEYVDSHKIGFTVNPYSSDDISSLLDKVMHNPDIIEAVRDKMYQEAIKETTWDEDFCAISDRIKEFRHE